MKPMNWLMILFMSMCIMSGYLLKLYFMKYINIKLVSIFINKNLNWLTW